VAAGDAPPATLTRLVGKAAALFATFIVTVMAG
jgi:hypothetical protein